MKKGILLCAACLTGVLGATFAPAATASGGGDVVKGLADMPPEAKIQVLRIIFEDLFGTPEELKVRFVEACNARMESTPESQEAKGTPSGTVEITSETSASGSKWKEATLSALCVPAVRSRIEAALTPEQPQSGSTDSEATASLGTDPADQQNADAPD